MSNQESLDEFIRSIERLGLSAEDKAFLISVRKQFEAEMAAAEANNKRPDAPAADS